MPRKFITVPLELRVSYTIMHTNDSAPAPLAVEESDVESATEDVPSAELAQTKDEPADATMKDEEDEKDDDEEDPETYIVEAIMDHRSDFEDGHMRYHVKWKGYEKKADRTWETEDNLEGAKEILEEYLKNIGGKPAMDHPKSSAKKRGRQSTGGKQPDTGKRPKMAKTSRTSSGKGKSRKSNGANDVEQDGSPIPLIGYTDEGDDDWKAPPAKDGAWDPLVQAVDTVTRENADGELWGYLIWNAKNEDGRFYRSKAKLPVIYRACPQRMLHFYEKHLVFSTSAPDAAADAPAKDDEEAAE